MLDTILENNWHWANVIAADENSGAEMFADRDLARPMLVIASSNGTVKYAGPADTFLSLQVLRSVIPDLAMQDTPADQPRQQTDQVETTAAPAGRSRQTSQKPELDELTIAQAERALMNAENLMNLGRMTSYKKAIDACRKVLEKYPDTKYADRARELLRKVPEWRRKTYKITNEELGL